jgi:hypothetical protein
MNANTSACALFLYPEQADFCIEDLSQFIIRLQEYGFIAETITNQKSSFYTGNRFLDYIAYMGCSPAIQFEASKSNEHFCFIRIHRYDKAKLIVSQKQARAPHCPHCNKPVNEWQKNKTQETLYCGQCHTTANIAEFNWRKMAGYGRMFIEITDIFPKEAIPQQILLDKLTAISKTDWSYFYSCK